MNIAKLRSRTESCGLVTLKIKVLSEGNFAQLFVAGGPVLSVYRNKRIRLQGRNLELMQGVFPDNFEISRAIADYMIRTANTGKRYEVVATTDDPLTCRNLVKLIRELNVHVRMKCALEEYGSYDGRLYSSEWLVVNLNQATDSSPSSTVRADSRQVSH